ncbi:MAG: hypothetical protein ABFE08_05395 [Armatimonadia bacterium]
MLYELTSTALEVVKAPSQRRDARPWDGIRVVQSRNADWYRRFCAKHASSRKRNKRLHDTRIKRQDTIRLLENMIAGRQVSIYCQDIIEEAQRRLDAAEPAPF